MLAEAAEARQVSAHAAFLNAAVSNRFVNLYTSSVTSSHMLPLPASVSTEKSVTLLRTHPSGTETQGATNAFLEEQEQEQELTFTRYRSPSTVISLGDREEEELIRETPYSPVQLSSLSPFQSPTFSPVQPDDFYILGAGSLENRISEPEPSSTSTTSRVS